MTRLFALLFVMTATGPASAGVIVPRLVLPPDVLPKADEPADPAALADRIAKTTKAVGDKLAEADTGTGTRKDQDQIRRDIDALIKALENQPPPPMPMGGGGSGNPPPMGGQNQPQGQGGGRQPRGGQQPMGQPKQPMGGQPMPQGGQPMPMGGQPQNGKPQAGQPQNGKPMGGTTPGTGGAQTPPGMPLAESIAKDFWGHLPEQPRQRMMQFFREQYMSRYKDLLPKYYQSLAEKEKKGKK